MRRSTHFLAAALLAGTVGVAAAPAAAVTCTVNIEAAYQRAVSNGWRFICKAGVLTFNNRKHVGCVVKTGVMDKVFASLSFFQKNRVTFHNGWQLDSYRMSGGQFNKFDATASGGIVSVGFIANGPFGTGRRHLSELKLRKDGGNCKALLSEAF